MLKIVGQAEVTVRLKAAICLCLAILFAGIGRAGAARTGPAATVPVMMLSDLHFDPLHDAAKGARLAAAPVAEWDRILKEPDSEHQAEEFAAVQTKCGARGVDTDFALLSASLRGAREQGKGVAFVTVTGDLLVHDFECRYDYAVKEKPSAGYAEFAEKTAVYVIQQVERSFPGVPVYVAGGNNDSSCGDYRLDQQDRYLAGTSTAVIGGLRDANEGEVKRARADYEVGGYFGVTLKPLRRTRLLVLNDIYLSKNYETCPGKKDSAGADAQLAWLDRELTEAKARGEAVWVMGHIPPGVNLYSTLGKGKNVCAGGKISEFLGDDRLTEILVRHAAVVRLGLFGHTHEDELRLLAGAGGRVPLKLVASISPLNGNRPTFTVAQVEAETALLKDYSVFMASNDTGKDTTWAKEYSFGDTYHEPDFSAASVADLVGQFQGDAADLKPASHAYETYFAPTMLPVLSLVWRQYGCGLNHTTEAEYKNCVCGAKASKAE